MAKHNKRTQPEEPDGCIKQEISFKKEVKDRESLSFTVRIASNLWEILAMWAGVFVLGGKGLEEVCEVFLRAVYL